MSSSEFRFHTFTRRDVLWLLPLMFGAWILLMVFGLDADVAFLGGISSAIISVIGFAYREAYRDARYWITIAAYGLIHAAVFGVLGGGWIPKPTVAIVPVFLLDYVVMAFLLPKISGIKFYYD